VWLDCFQPETVSTVSLILQQTGADKTVETVAKTYRPINTGLKPGENEINNFL